MNKEQLEPRPLEKVADLVEIAGAMQPMPAVVSGGERIEDLLLVESARDHGIIGRIVLAGNDKKIHEAVEKVGIDIPREDILPAESDEEAAALTVNLLKQGEVEMVLKGSTPTHVLQRHMRPLAVRNTVSLVTIFDAAPIGDGRPMILTDAGVNAVCNYARLTGIIRNAIDVAHHVMRIETPKVALLSANEKVLSSLPSTLLGAALADHDWPNAVVYGPLSLDLATDPGAVATKGLPDVPAANEVAGHADILVCPNIESGNVLYKLLSALIKYGEASLANIIMGFPKPYVLLSRSDALESRLNSLALGAIYAQRGLGQETVPHPVSPASPIKPCHIVVINPGSTSTKMALYENERCCEEKETQYVLPTVATPKERREQAHELADRVMRFLGEANWSIVDAIAARGGFVPRPKGKLAGGTYVIAEIRAGKVYINDALVAAMLEKPEKQHASNLGIPVAAILAERLHAPAYFTDPVIVDEFLPEAEISGYKGITRRSTSHALSIRAAAGKAAEEFGVRPDEVNLVVAHLGGGVTIAAIQKGRMVDSNIALLGGGPFTPQRAGQLPASDLIDLCYSGRFTREELYEELTKRGGIQSYLGDYRLEQIEERIQGGDEFARLIVDAMVYQIAKEIGAMYAACSCNVDAIVLTGGMIRAERVREGLRKRMGRLAPVLLFSEALEMHALAAGALQAVTGASVPKVYSLHHAAIDETGDPCHE